MSVEKNIENLKKYIRIDRENIIYDDSDFGQFCKSHCEDIEAVLNELEKYINRDKIKEILDDIGNNKPTIAVLKLRKLIGDKDK